MKPKDITGRVLGRPLHSPYAPGGGSPSRRRWLWRGVAGRLLWVGAFSDHSFWRIARLRHELRTANAEIARVKSEESRLDARLRDPAERARHAEEVLRQQGMARPGEIVYRLGTGSADSSRH